MQSYIRPMSVACRRLGVQVCAGLPHPTARSYASHDRCLIASNRVDGPGVENRDLPFLLQRHMRMNNAQKPVGELTLTASTTGTSLKAEESLFLSPYHQVCPTGRETVRIPGTRNIAASANLKRGVHEYYKPNGRQSNYCWASEEKDASS